MCVCIYMHVYTYIYLYKMQTETWQEGKRNKGTVNCTEEWDQKFFSSPGIRETDFMNVFEKQR